MFRASGGLTLPYPNVLNVMKRRWTYQGITFETKPPLYVNKIPLLLDLIHILYTPSSRHTFMAILHKALSEEELSLRTKKRDFSV